MLRRTKNYDSTISGAALAITLLFGIFGLLLGFIMTSGRSNEEKARWYKGMVIGSTIRGTGILFLFIIILIIIF